MRPVNVGVIGCGTISKAYFNGMKKFPILNVTACADINMKSAEAKAAEFGIKACTVEKLLKDKDIELVLNLTIPAAHVPVNLKILNAGKHAYTEKPFGLDTKSAKKVLDLAKKKKRLTGCAPDTVLGAGTQTSRRLIDEGLIGKPIAATAFMVCHGPESWHPNPEFYYKKGGGPLFDMGPYYLSSLITLLGPVKKICGFTRKSFPQRLITSSPFYGRKAGVEVNTHVAGTLEFVNGAICTIIMSFDIWKGSLPRIEIHGTAGSLSVPDPNTFGGPVRLFQGKDGGVRFMDFADMALRYPYAENLRGMGVADMGYAIRNRRAVRPSGELAYHVVEVMETFDLASRAGRTLTLKSTCGKPAVLPCGLPFGVLDK